MELFLLNKIIALLSGNIPIVLVTLFRHEGSSPRTAGSRMIVNEHQETYGTIGGGILEAKTIARAQSLFETKDSCIVELNLTAEDKNTIDMVCGGNVEILLEYIAPGDDHIKLFRDLKEKIKQGEKGYYLTLVKGKEIDKLATKRCVTASGGDFPGLDDRERSRLVRCLNQCGHSTKMRSCGLGSAMVIIDPILSPCRVVILGAGHVSLPTSELAKKVGFAVTVIDDRQAYANQDRFETADHVIVVDDFKNAFHPSVIDQRTFIIIMTRGHVHDEIVLRQALNTSAGYIGMIGSRKKARHIYDRLMADGIEAEVLNNVHCPIGLGIDAETPDEIAVSIVAELIQKRHAILSGVE